MKARSVAASVAASAGASVGASALALALSSCAAAIPADGGDSSPTFVSLNPCLDAILVEVADRDQILALSHYSRDASSSSMDVELAKQFAITGGTAEEVIALRPDIVLAGSFIAPATKAALERAGMRVETFGSPASVADSLDQIGDIAAITGHQDKGAQLIARIDQPVSGFTTGPSALLWQPGQIVAGENQLITQLIVEGGFTNYAAERGLAQADHISLEQVISDPPDVLLVGGDSVGQRHPALESLDATKVYGFDPGLFYCGGPSIVEARRELNALRMSIEGVGS